MLIPIILVLALLAPEQPAGGARDWAWFRAANAARGWWVTEGRASVELTQGRLEARLYDQADPEFLRLELRGQTQGGEFIVHVRVEATDHDPEFTVSGRLKRYCGPTGGREVLLLTDGSEAIGLFRDLPAGAKCTPA